MVLTALYFVVSNFVHAGKPRTKPDDLHNFWLAWKWFFMLHQLMLSMEFLITIYYWVAIFSPEKAPVFSYIDHSLPFALLLADYVMFSSCPMTFRGLLMVFLYGVVYLTCFLLPPPFVWGFSLYTGMSF